VGFELRLNFCTKEFRSRDAAMDAQVGNLMAQFKAGLVDNAALSAETLRLRALKTPRGVSGGTHPQSSYSAVRSAGSPLTCAASWKRAY
jgi:hypothetical protein